VGQSLLAQEKKQTTRALTLAEQAVSIVEKQRGIVPSLEGRQLFVEKHGSAFEALLQSRLAAQQFPQAFASFEQYHARVYLDRLSERGITLDTALPPELKQEQDTLLRQRRIAIRTRERLLDRIGEESDSARRAELKNKLEPELKKNETEIDALRIAQRELEVKIRAAQPKLASFQYPKPLSVAGAQAILDPGTLLLTYYTHREATHLFVVTRTSFRHIRMPLPQKQLENQVQAFRSLLATRQSPIATVQKSALTLGETLLSPVKTDLAAARRVLICPEGALQLLPFSALRMKSGKQTLYLAEYKALHLTPSVSVYRELLRYRSQPKPARVLALGDPLYPEENRTPRQQEFVTQGGRLGRLKRTAEQVQLLQKLYPDVIALVREKATRPAVFANAGQARLMHFGCHGVFSTRNGLDSALALTPEGKEEDGLLRGWEVIQQMRLRADLVVLGACQTGLGSQLRGEGVLGLATAFGYAGAASLLASSWEVDEASTNLLLQGFYTHWKSGKPKDEALRLAMEAVRRRPAFAHPYYWSAFSLTGDWK
jgi:CHAT domain-containing protein